VALWLLSCVLIVKPNEIAFIERFGRPKVSGEDRARGLQASVYRSGCHLKLPWPFETAHRVPAETIFSKELGKVPWEPGEKRTVPGKGAMPMTDPNIILWNEVHVDPHVGYEANFLVPSFEEVKEVEPGAFKAPAINIARLEADIQYRVKRNEKGEPDEAAAYEFYYRHADVHRLVDDVGYVVMCRLAAGQNFLRWINVDRGEVSLRYQKLLQEELERLHTGLEVVYAGIPSVHPPAETALAYEDVIKSSQEKEGTIHDAASAVANITNSAIGKAARLTSEANSYRYRLETFAAAEANRFDVQLEAYRKAPEVYRYRKYFSALEEVLLKQRLFVVPTTEQEVLMMDLQEKLRADITDINIEEAFK
jgi:regulator of protease activity HflC (stomatin/prohibitin superfamily)